MIRWSAGLLVCWSPVKLKLDPPSSHRATPRSAEHLHFAATARVASWFQLGAARGCPLV